MEKKALKTKLVAKKEFKVKKKKILRIPNGKYKKNEKSMSLK